MTMAPITMTNITANNTGIKTFSRPLAIEQLLRYLSVCLMHLFSNSKHDVNASHEDTPD